MQLFIKLSKIYTALLLIFIVSILHPLSVFAQQTTLEQGEDKQSISDKITFPYYSDVECKSTTGTPSLVMFGDSLTVGMKTEGDLESKLTTKGWQIGKIEATDGFNLTDTLPKIQADAGSLSTANTVIIALGTNREANFATFKSKVSELVEKIKSKAPTAKLFWVNAYTEPGAFLDNNGYNNRQLNAFLDEKAATLGYTVIDWKKEVTGKPDKYPFLEDGVHHTPQGYKKKAEFIASKTQPANTTAGNSATQTTTDTSPTTTGSADDSFIQKITPAPFSGKKNNPTGVVLHWTGGSPNQSVQSFISGIGGRGLSVQLYIDGGGKVYQLTPTLDTHTSHASDANSKTIGIEIGAGSDGKVETAEKEINANEVQQQAVIKTVAYLVQEFNMQTDPDVTNLKGILSHHLVSPGRKSDVGDTYHQKILTAVKNGGIVTTTACKGSGGPVSGSGGTPEQNKELVRSLLPSKGWGEDQWPCMLELWTKESGFQAGILNKSSKAAGIPQALPGSKIYGPSFDSMPTVTRGNQLFLQNPDARKEIDWGLQYIVDRYGTPCKAVEWHHAHNWY